MRPRLVSEETDEGRARLGREIHVLTNFNEIGINRGNFDYLQFSLCEKTILHGLANTVRFKSRKLSFWNISYVSRIKTKFLEYKICFKDKISRNISIICTMLVRTLYGAEK